jgi:hypothetical protein
MVNQKENSNIFKSKDENFIPRLNGQRKLIKAVE